MTIHRYAVILARQTLNTKKSAKEHPFIYDTTDLDLRELATDELNKLYVESLEITTRIHSMLEQRG